MSSRKSWASLDEYGTKDRKQKVRIDDIKVMELPKEEYTDVLQKMNRGEKLTVDEIQKLPENYQTFYYLQDDGMKEEYDIKRREKIRIAKAKRKARLEHERIIYEKVLRKILANMSLLPYEKEIYEKYSSKVSDIQEPEICIDAVDILNDIVKGNYSLQDVEMIRKTSELPPPNDDFQNSPIRILDNVVENIRQQTHDTLQNSQSDHFFKTVETDIQNRLTPIKLDEIISSCATGS